VSPHGLALAALVVGALLAGLATWAAARPAAAWQVPVGLRVTFLDVGQGDAVLVETKHARVLVDQGPPEGDAAHQLVELGVRSLSALVLTHPQRDHVGGAAEVLRRLDVAQVLDPGLAATGPEQGAALREAKARGIPVRTVRAGSVFRAGRLVMRALWPADAGTPAEDPNLNAVVLAVSYGAIDLLLPADAESEVSRRLPIGEIEILKVAHHGSRDPGLADELRDLRPRVAVISCGRDNDYGHPHPDTLAALTASPGTVLYRTDLDGRVVVESDGRTLAARSER
jgi:competence protein ComEC